MEREPQPGPLSLVETLSLGLFVSALTSACQGYIERVAPPGAREDEIAEFRKQALRCIENAVGEGIAIEDEADAMRRAREHVDHLCQEWLRQDGDDIDRGEA